MGGFKGYQGVTPEAQKPPEDEAKAQAEYMTAVEMITLAQRKYIDELAKQNNFSKLQIAEMVKTQGWEATSITKLTKAEGDLLILLMDIGAEVEESPPGELL